MHGTRGLQQGMAHPSSLPVRMGYSSQSGCAIAEGWYIVTAGTLMLKVARVVYPHHDPSRANTTGRAMARKRGCHFVGRKVQFIALRDEFLGLLGDSLDDLKWHRRHGGREGRTK
jgi:hypothetical protein